MQYAIEMYFDTATEKAIYNVANKIAERGISSKFMDWKTRPHVTLACFNDVDEDRCQKLLKDFAITHGKKPAYLGSVGMFNDTKTIFLSPIMTKTMYDLQRELQERMNVFDTAGWEWYLPDRWVPHCTVALTGEDPEEAFFDAADLVLHEFEKLQGTFTSLGLVKVTFPVEELYTVELL
nr:2'-5' RNA ligase family protein [uncultured Eisenbergiella sp.]